VNDAAVPEAPPRPRWRFWLFVGIMLALTVLFLGLGKWQLDRLAWKNGLIATAEQHMKVAPVAFPPAAQWPGLDVAAWAYRPVTITGRYHNDKAVRVFVGLGDSAKGRYSGTGYWIMTPFALEGGGTVFVDRGFVPQPEAGRFADDRTAPTGIITLTGVVVPSENAGFFTPAPDKPQRIDWVRDVGRLAATLDAAAQPVAPVYIDLPAGPPGALPQGGETVVDFPNSHLGYAMTWFGFALTTMIMLAEWIRRQRR
jgi:surfeit locus 1 family protein